MRPSLTILATITILLPKFWPEHWLVMQDCLSIVEGNITTSEPPLHDVLERGDQRWVARHVVVEVFVQAPASS